MKKIYNSPFQVFLLLSLFALLGIYFATTLPISLFPNSSKPVISVRFGSFDGLSTQEFIRSFGDAIDEDLHKIQTDKLSVEAVRAQYTNSTARFECDFSWGNSPREALREVQGVVSKYSAVFSQDLRDSIQIEQRNENTGFLSVAFFSEERSIMELFTLLEPLLVPQIQNQKDTHEAFLHNPNQKELRIELKPESLIHLGILASEVISAIKKALRGYSMGTVDLQDEKLNLVIPTEAFSIDTIGNILVGYGKNQWVYLQSIAQIELSPSNRQAIKTNNIPSLMLWVHPKSGANIKQMAEDALGMIDKTLSELPKDIHYKILVDPSEYIRSAIFNLSYEVIFGALLAVFVLFFFLGGVMNVITAAIEIPISLVLAFILMKIFGVNINLISLGGLALASGMNVDASVVVIENIYRHLDQVKNKLNFEERLGLICKAVAEVRFAVLLSTLTSLIVFIPLAFTSGLGYALLGDLAKAVVFSHGFSAVVALILVPTIRLFIRPRSPFAGGSVLSTPDLPDPSSFTILYTRALTFFLSHKPLIHASYASLGLLFIFLLVFILPRLPKEIMARPETDLVILSLKNSGQGNFVKMEKETSRSEQQIMEKFAEDIQYTLSKTMSARRSTVMLRLKNKKRMEYIWKELEKDFLDTDSIHYVVYPWNPSEMDIPEPPQMRLVARGGSAQEKGYATREIVEKIKAQKIFQQITTEPSVLENQEISLEFLPEKIRGLKAAGMDVDREAIGQMLHLSDEGNKVGNFLLDHCKTDIYVQLPEKSWTSLEELRAMPFKVGGASPIRSDGTDSLIEKVIPLKAFAKIAKKEAPFPVYKEDGREVFAIFGRSDTTENLSLAKTIVADWTIHHPESNVRFAFEPADKEITDALWEIFFALIFSLALVFLLLLLQFGNFREALLVMVSIPLGILGVILSLFFFQSTLSVNSLLGVILLNGISVTNSILLVDFTKHCLQNGDSLFNAVVTAAQVRLRPILITSLTTILGMLPISLGLGEGGKILQPLGIAVCGGMSVSTILTLFLVPALFFVVTRRG